jgi:hypothetical protein
MAGTVHKRRRKQRLEGTGGIGDHAFQRVGARAAEALDPRIAVAPQHALRHTGRAAGVEDVEVVWARGNWRRIGRGRCERILVPDGSRQQFVARLVAHLQQHSQGRHRGQYRRERWRELAVEHDCRGCCVVQQVREFFGDVPIVDVEGGDAGLECAQHRLEVFVAVVEVDRNVVLPAFVPGQFTAFAMATEAGAVEVVRQPAGSLGELLPREASIAKDETLCVGLNGSDRLVHLSNGEVHGRRLLRLCRSSLIVVGVRA